MVNVEIADYTSLEFGVMYAASVSEVNNRTAQKAPASVLQGKEFKVDITGLTANTKYYYCAYFTKWYAVPIWRSKRVCYAGIK